jgi:hypothetical protein
MSVFFTDAVVDSMAPGLATFSRAAIPDISAEFPEAPYWIQNYFLNTIVGAQFGDRVKQAALGFLRRADQAFQNYHDARRRTLEYVASFTPGRPKVRLYYDALADWESFVLQAQMATDLYVFLAKTKAFEPGDGSPEQRLYDMANVVKHFRGHISSQRFSSEDLLPVWVGEAGLFAPGIRVTYDEASDVLRAIAKVADVFQNPGSLRKPTTNASVSDGSPAS